ncbi:MAG: hypothetical protein HFH54_07855 [Lachnospiraceae bacterium]|nr:hypothetical protein [Lachnospiraceae bacterium]
MNKFKFMATAAAVSVLITGGSVSVHAASTQEQIEAVQEGKAQSESELAETQERIMDLEGQRGGLEGYLSELSQQYEDLSAGLEELTGKAKQKQKELKLVKKELKRAKEKEKEQYENMKIRISYMYENSKGNLLTSLLSADSFTDLLTRAENFMQISKYDREMLKKYEQTKEKVADQKTAIKVEQEAIAQLQAESAEKRQEVEALAASTQEEISFYSEQIGRAEGEAADLLELVNEQSVQLASLMDKAEEEAEAARKAAEAELARQQEEEARLAQAAEQSPDVDPKIDPEVSLEASAQASPEETLQEGDGEDQTAAGEGDLEAAVGEAVEGTADQEEGETAGSEDTPEAAVTPEAAAQPEPTQAADTTGTGNSAGTYLGDFTLTAYCNCSKCCGSWSGGGTASGTVPTAGRTVAMGGIPFGTKLLINGNVYTVEDRGTGYGHVDIYMDSHSAALQFGSQKAAVYQLNN